MCFSSLILQWFTYTGEDQQITVGFFLCSPILANILFASKRGIGLLFF